MAVNPHDSHGSTPAAWTAVIVMMVGCTVSALGVVLLEWWIIILGFVVIVIGGLAGKVMAMMGMGQTASLTNERSEELAAGRTVDTTDTNPATRG